MQYCGAINRMRALCTANTVSHFLSQQFSCRTSILAETHRHSEKQHPHSSFRLDRGCRQPASRPARPVTVPNTKPHPSSSTRPDAATPLETPPPSSSTSSCIAARRTAHLRAADRSRELPVQRRALHVKEAPRILEERDSLDIVYRRKRLWRGERPRIA